MSVGSMEDSPGRCRGFVPRADGTEGRTYGSSSTGGFEAAEWSRRVAEHHGDVTEAMRARLVETGRAVEDADIQYLELRGWSVPQGRLPALDGDRRHSDAQLRNMCAH
ncbi:hypothetical protein [Kitasatospora aureofaciens]|uniref:hypothetical protein n=1 Tax=Kitasatospora aureofaciens TaxID=1894 RepID=UPI0037CBC483